MESQSSFGESIGTEQLFGGIVIERMSLNLLGGYPKFVFVLVQKIPILSVLSFCQIQKHLEVLDHLQDVGLMEKCS